MYSDMQANDIKRSAEKAYRSAGKWQVVHYHGYNEQCADQCVAYGIEGEVPVRG